MAKTPKYPNPAFFRAKDNMDWKAQGENLKEVFDIAKDMLLATDWKAFGARQKQGWIDFAKRVAEEASEIAAMSCASCTLFEHSIAKPIWRQAMTSE